jgi:hypothetical protein
MADTADALRGSNDPQKISHCVERRAPEFAALLRHLPFIGIEPPKADAEQHEDDDYNNQNLS